MSKKTVAAQDMTVEDKLRSLMDLQIIDSRIDRIRTVRGELPLEVEDLEDEIQGLETRIQKKNAEVAQHEAEIGGKKNLMREAATLIAKYEAQQMNVRNNREFDSLAKEIEYQSLEIQLAEKRIKEFNARIDLFQQEIVGYQTRLDERKIDLSHKKSELDAIIAETKKEEEDLLTLSDKYASIIEERFINAYRRVRANTFNGLAVVPVDRDSCGGCFNQIPPQRKMEISLRKKVNVCEHCGRMIVDEELANEEMEKVEKLLR
jgi:predicted  nucleic acid-binding Zn-ribbon protein